MRSSLAKTKLYCVDQALDPKLEITRYIASFIQRRGHYPTFLFRHPKGFEHFPILMNWLTRDAILRTLDVDEDHFDRVLASRLRERECVRREVAPLFTRGHDGFDALPVLQHQPGDLGRYLTSFVTVLPDPEHGHYNTGFYRVYVKSSKLGVIFMGPRSHGYGIVSAMHAQGQEAYVTLFAGGALAHSVIAASTIPRELDSIEAACRLAHARLPMAPDPVYPPAPADAEIVIHARVLATQDVEAPFGEFKGYYCTATQSPVLAIDRIWSRPDAMYPGLFCGKESGLTLMSLSNEIMLHQRLVDRGFCIRKVRYPLAALGEFLTVVEADDAGEDLLHAVMECDHRTKMVVLTDCAQGTLRDLATFRFDAFASPYLVRNEPHGSRIGAIVRRRTMERVEY